MAFDVLITDPADARIAGYRNVTDADLLRAHGAFIAEGRLVVRRLLTASRYRCRSVLVTPAARASLGDALDGHDHLPVFVGTLDMLQSITGVNIHRGCLAIGERPDPLSVTEATSGGDVTVVLEGVANADNVGGIFRTAAAFGAEGIVLGPGCADPLYRKAIRTSMGAALSLRYAIDARWPAALDDLRQSGWTIVALTPDASADPIGAIGGAPNRRVALLVGSEGFGLTSAALARADRRARIPMRGGVDSLNVAVAAGIALHAVTRQHD